MEDYLTIDGEFENLVVIERSKFICYCKGVQDEEDAKDFISKINKINSLATHNCYAYISDEKGLVQKFSDDGEPQGTAGMPMLEVLRAKKIYKSVAVVTRYFGGIKLGAGGLVRAYSGSVAECIDKCKVVNMRSAVFYEVNSDYENYSKLLNLSSKKSYLIINSKFGDKISLTFAVVLKEESDFLQALSDLFKGKADCKKIKEDYYKFN